MRSKLILITLMGLVSHAIHGQFVPERDSTEAHMLQIASTAIVSYGQDVPFWLLANNSERLTGNDALGGLFTVHAHKTPNNQRIDYFYGLEGQFVITQTSRAELIQGYAGLRIGGVNLHLGMKEELFGLNDSTLSVGNLVYGNNARPIPKLVLSTPDWVASPILGKVFSFKAYLAHGWFEQDRFQSNAFLHQKYVYVRGQAFKKKLTLTAGLHHNAQWGGENLDQETSQPVGLGNFARIFMGLSGGNDARVNDQLNALGNHLGTYDLSASFDFGKFTLSNYWQFIWEDKSGLTPFNWRDGLIGISLKNKNRNGLISGFNAELVRTGSQDAVKFDDDVRIFEPDNFFNNTAYKSGWTYQQRVIGNAMFFMLNPGTTTNQKVKNVMNGINLGIEGQLKGIGYQVNYLSFKNHGTLHERIDPGLRLNLIAIDCNYVKGPHIFGMRSSFEWGNYPGRNAGVLLTYARLIRL